MNAPRRKTIRAARSEAGFGMIELVCAMTVMAIGLMAVFAMFQSSAIQVKRAANVTTAAAIADSEMELFRATTFSSIGLDDAAVSAADATYAGYSAYPTDGPSTTLTGTITSTATSLTVSSAASFPTTAPFRIRIESEVLLVETGAGTTTWTVARGQDGTAAAAHASGIAVVQKHRVHLAPCGTAPCTSKVPTKTVTGADGKTYRVDTYAAWSAITNAGGTSGRNVKLVTIVVRDGTTGVVLVRVSGSFDESTGL